MPANTAFDAAFRYAVAVGANLGDRAATIAAAAELIEASGVARVVARSPLIETAPVGGPAQPPYLNGAWVVASSLLAVPFLRLLLDVEARLGRTRTVHWGPRTLDLDLLLREDGLVVDAPDLQLPHPRLHERLFVLDPLTVVASTWRHPQLGRTVAQLRDTLASGDRPPINRAGSRQA